MSEINYEILIDDSNQYIIELNEQGPQGNTGPRGPQGPKGETGTAATLGIGTVTTGNPGTNASVINSGTSSNAVFDFIIPRGDKGEKGSSITSITKTGTVGLVDTYTITYGDGDTTTFTVTNGAQGNDGRGITSITKTDTSGLIDTYTITYSDNTTSTFTVTNGQDGTNGTDGFSPIATVTKSGDTATISITDANGTTTATITDGADGSSEWGTITGSISSQTDLSNALDNKANIDLSNLSNTGKDYINQSKALETGSISTNSNVYNWIKSMKDNSFDLSKFTLVGTPTISNNGIASNFTTHDFLRTPIKVGSLNANSFKISCEFTFSNAASQSTLISSRKTDWPTNTETALSFITNNSKLLLFLSSNGTSWDIANTVYGQTTLQSNIPYRIEIEFTGTQYIVKLTNLSTGVETTEITRTSSSKIYNGDNLIQIGAGGFDALVGTADLKAFSIEVEGTEIFTGQETGSDTVTIGGSSVTIPYIVSKTGSKIADVAYRTNIQNLYSETGIAKYFTIDETNQNFTLPMGEVYGMMGQSAENLTEVYPVIEPYQSGGSWYRVYSDGWCEQGGHLSVNGNVSIVYLKAFADMNYTLIVVPNTDSNTSSYLRINTSGWVSKSTTGFSTYCDTTCYKEWVAFGRIGA